MQEYILPDYSGMGMESPSPSDIIGKGGMGGVPGGFPDYGHDWHGPQLRLGGIDGSVSPWLES
jgi:hypothetical protein